MKTPIKPSEIRKGDLIRIEWTRSQCGSSRALEYVALSDKMGMRRKLDSLEWHEASHYLLDRPTPVVDLPSEPTLGWLTYDSGDQGGSTLGHWYRFNSHIAHDNCAGSYSHEYITAFTPATAVPTEALNELRKTATTHNGADCHLHTGLSRFLAAIDKAGDQS